MIQLLQRKDPELRRRFREAINQVETLVSTPALAEADVTSWSMSTDVVEQVVERDGDALRFTTGEFTFHLTDQLRTVFEDEEGRTGQGRVQATHLDGSTTTEWLWDKGIEFPMHRHAFREILVFIRGSWSMVIHHPGEEPHTAIVSAGQTFVIPAGVPHGGRCLEETEVKSITIPALR